MFSIGDMVKRELSKSIPISSNKNKNLSKEESSDATKKLDTVLISMFLLSHSLDKPDVIDMLANINKFAEVRIFVDSNAYDTFTNDSGEFFVKDSLNELVKYENIKAYAVKKNVSQWQDPVTGSVDPNPKVTYHDKLISIQEKDENGKVVRSDIIIGSAGLTDNVQDNFNLENMLLIHVDKMLPYKYIGPNIHNIFVKHFSTIRKSNNSLYTVTQLVDKKRKK